MQEKKFEKRTEENRPPLANLNVAQAASRALVVPGSAESNVIIHVPHSSDWIPPAIRDQFVVDDVALAHAQAHLVDWHTDTLATAAAQRTRLRPWLFINRMSRFAVDPERFPDERESMNAKGMGAVYERDAHGTVIRPAGDYSRLIDDFFTPYAEQLHQLVSARLQTCGSVNILDLHSFPREALPYEDGSAPRPEICLGSDEFHTPSQFIDAARECFGDIEVNSPFAGTYVPLPYFRAEPRVLSVMVEVRRDTYMQEPGGPLTANAQAVVGNLASYINQIGEF